MSPRCGQQISIDEMREKLASSDKTSRREIDGSSYRKAAVLVPLACWENQWHLLFTRRSTQVQDHKGQVSFPGGAIEAGDASVVFSALRETQEEIGINPEDVSILGVMRDFPTITGYLITPVVGVIPWPTVLSLAEEEVSRAFIIPIEWLSNFAHHEEIEMTFPNGWKERVIHFHLYEDEKLWGITARITLEFLNIIGFHK